MFLNRLLIKMIAPPPKIETYGRHLFVAPHPDDVEIAAGSTVARLCREGKEVYFLVCTDGRYGTKDENLSQEELVEIRKREQLASAELLGVKDVIFLPYRDGGLYDEDDLRKDIAKTIAEIKPDVVYAADPKLYPECHPDHLKSARATAAAYIFSSFRNVMRDFGYDGSADPKALAFFYTGRPNRRVKTKKQDVRKMLDAFAVFKSQFPDEREASSLRLYMRMRSRLNGLRGLHLNADAFRVQNNLTVHCCAEAEDR